jgi:hypothetical protein
MRMIHLQYCNMSCLVDSYAGINNVSHGIVSYGINMSS